MAERVTSRPATTSRSSSARPPAQLRTSRPTSSPGSPSSRRAPNNTGVIVGRAIGGSPVARVYACREARRVGPKTPGRRRGKNSPGGLAAPRHEGGGGSRTLSAEPGDERATMRRSWPGVKRPPFTPERRGLDRGSGRCGLSSRPRSNRRQRPQLPTRCPRSPDQTLR